MVANNVEKLAEELENQELEAPSGVASPQVYSQLLAVYLCQNDLCNAKFLWKRIPQEIKTSNQELRNIWTVGQHLWKGDFGETYKALNAGNWSEAVSELMSEVQVVIRARAVDLISKAYSSITLDKVMAMTGLSAEVCTQACLEKGWKVEKDTKMVYPTKPKPELIAPPSSEDQLYKLTDFVSFLEN